MMRKLLKIYMVEDLEINKVKTHYLAFNNNETTSPNVGGDGI